MPGKVTLDARVYDIDDVEKLTIRIKGRSIGAEDRGVTSGE
jgi:hypothetical protein